MSKRIFAVTGALSYSGKYISEYLVKKYGAENLIIRNFTNHSRQNVLQEKFPALTVENCKYDFDDPVALRKSFEGVEGFASTYWVRFDDYKITRETVINNAKSLIDAAKDAGVRRVAYASHTQATVDSNIPYIRGKALLEQHLRETYEGKNYGVIRPCGIFGDTPQESILVNNLAWLLRTFPFFLLPADGQYPFHFVHVRDFADLFGQAITREDDEAMEVDAIAPDKLDFKDLLENMRDILGVRCRIMTGFPESLCYYATFPINWLQNDILMDKQDLQYMMTRLTRSDQEPMGNRRLLEFVQDYKDTLGKEYISSLKRYY